MSSNFHPSVISDRLTNKITWRLAPLIIAMYCSNQLDRANIGYAALSMNSELGLTATDFGLATSVFFIGYILCEVPSNLFMHRVGARIWMARILLTWGVASSLTAFVPNKEWLFGIRFVLGAFEAGLFPGIVYFLTLWLPARNRVMLMSLFVMAIPLTGVIGAPISTLIMQDANIFGMTGWRAMVFVEGLPAFILAFVVFFILPDRPGTAKWLTADEIDEIEMALDYERSLASQSTPRHGAADVFKDAKVWLLGFIYFGVNSAIIALLYFLPQIIKSMESGYSVKYTIVQIGLISAVPFGFAVVCMIGWGRYMTRRAVGPIHVAGPLLVCAAALAVALYLPSTYLALAAFAIGTAACFCTMITFWQIPSRFLCDRGAAAGIALITSIGVSAGIVTPYAIGWIKDKTGGFATAFLGVAAFLVLGSIAVFGLELWIRSREAHIDGLKTA